MESLTVMTTVPPTDAPTSPRPSARPPAPDALPATPTLAKKPLATVAAAAPPVTKGEAPAPPIPAAKIAQADDEEGGATRPMRRDEDIELKQVIAKITGTAIVKTEEGKSIEIKVERYKGPEPLDRRLLALLLLGTLIGIFSRFVAGKVGLGMVIIAFAAVAFAAVRLFPRLLLIERSYTPVLEVADEAKLEAANARRLLDDEKSAAQQAAEAAVNDGAAKDAEIDRLKALVDTSVPREVAETLMRRDPTNVGKCMPTNVHEVEIAADGTMKLTPVDLRDPVYSAACKVFYHWRHINDTAVTQCWLKRGTNYLFGDGVIVMVPTDNSPVKVIRRSLDKSDTTSCEMNKPATVVPKVGEIYVTPGPLAAAQKMFGGGMASLFDAKELETEARTMNASTDWIRQSLKVLK
jgi:hypothetical protein